MVLLDSLGRVVGHTETGLALCNGNSLFRITAQGVLVVEEPASQAVLARAMESRSLSLVRLRARGGRECLVVCAPVGGPDHGQSGLRLTVMDPVEPPDLSAVAGLYGLTPAETRLAEALLAHGSLDGAMKKLNVTRNTVRSQMTAIFRKTSTFRQAELVRLLTRLEVIAQMCDDI